MFDDEGRRRPSKWGCIMQDNAADASACYQHPTPPNLTAFSAAGTASPCDCNTVDLKSHKDPCYSNIDEHLALQWPSESAARFEPIDVFFDQYYVHDAEQNLNHVVEDQESVSLQDIELYLSSTIQHDYSNTTYGLGGNERTESSGMNPHATDIGVMTQEPLQHTTQASTTLAHRDQVGDVSKLKSGSRRRGRSSACAERLQQHGLCAYPEKVQLQSLAVEEGKTLKQVKVSLSNLRSRGRRRLLCLPASPNFVSNSRSTKRTPSVHHAIYSSASSIGGRLYTNCSDYTGPAWMSFQVESNPTHETTLLPSSLPQSLSPSSPMSSKSSYYELKSRGRKGKRWYQPEHNLPGVADAMEISQSPILRNSPADTENIYTCTFCLKIFKSEFDWRRHETGVHEYNHIEWPCPFHDTSLVGKQCTFCPEVVQDMAHYVERHGIHLCFGLWKVKRSSPPTNLYKARRRHICSNQSMDDYTFNRKDLLAQHIQGMHLCSADELVQRGFKVPKAWSKAVDLRGVKPDGLWCGFCVYSFISVSDRMTHVADHFRNGCKMDKWISRGTDYS